MFKLICLPESRGLERHKDSLNFWNEKCSPPLFEGLLPGRNYGLSSGVSGESCRRMVNFGGMMVKKLCLWTWLAVGWTAAGGQSLRVTPATVQLGEVALRSKNRVELVCVNVSSRPVVIRDIRTDCTCTRPVWSRSPLMPGDSVRVVVVLTPTDRGAFYKTVRFETLPAADETPQAVLRGKVY